MQPYMQRPPRVPTSWTKPLQYVVASVFAVYGLYTLSVPFWLGSTMSDYARRTALQQAEQSPQLYPDPNQYANLLSTIFAVSEWVGVVIGIAIAAVAIAGALRRWTWVYYVVLGLLALAVIGLPVSIAGLLGASPQTSQIQLPAWTLWVSVGYGVASIGLGVWMLIALITRGPWGMRRPLTGR